MQFSSLKRICCDLFTNSKCFQTQTITYLPTSTINYCPIPTVPDTSCGNPGMQWAFWIDQDIVGTHDPQAFALMTPPDSGTADPASLAGFYSGFCPYEDDTELIQFYNASGPCSHWDLQHRGFVYAGASGDYTFSLPTGIDDNAYVWVGDDIVVRSTYNSSNAVLNNSGSFSYTANAGEYVPLRIQ